MDMKSHTSNAAPHATRIFIRTTASPSKPKGAGYAEPKQSETTERSKPNPGAAGGESSQIAATTPGEDEENKDGEEPTPPGEHKREPIKDPDPADTKLHVHDASH